MPRTLQNPTFLCTPARDTEPLQNTHKHNTHNTQKHNTHTNINTHKHKHTHKHNTHTNTTHTTHTQNAHKHTALVVRL